MTFDHTRRPDAPDVYAPDGSEIRLLAANSAGSMCEVSLPPRGVSIPVRHRTVQEMWYVIAGTGQVWRQAPDGSALTVAVSAGSALAIPLGCRFQFRNTGPDDMRFVCVTTPPWPGEQEAIVEPAEGAWPDSPGERKRPEIEEDG
jgi:mannose-6-phosphate isomerase-like protein (cupin superfamily)